MALTKETIVDKIEVVTDYKIVQVRYADLIKEDGKIISSAYNPVFSSFFPAIVLGIFYKRMNK